MNIPSDQELQTMSVEQLRGVIRLQIEEREQLREQVSDDVISLLTNLMLRGKPTTDMVRGIQRDAIAPPSEEQLKERLINDIHFRKRYNDMMRASLQQGSSPEPKQ